MPYRLILVFLLLISLPYLSALLLAGPTHVFGGFLLNPVDGNSYLAKMYQGQRGDWKFTLPFTANPGQGGYLFTFYIFLGHLAGWLGAPLLLVYHLARLLGAVLLAWMGWLFLDSACPDEKGRNFAYILALFGLGMGWLVFFSGVVTSDFWVAEAYPFLSAYTNPHFAISLALLLWLLLPALENRSRQPSGRGEWWKALLTVLASAFLASLSPFAILLALGTLGGVFLWELVERRATGMDPESSEAVSFWRNFQIARPRRLLTQIACITLGGAPVALYAFLVVRQDAVLAAWNAQNLTFTPPAWDLLLSFSPALLLALPGVIQAYRSRTRPGRLLIVWVLLASALICLPFGLQRRFLVGAYLPIAALAAYGLDFLERRLGWSRKLVSTLTIGLALPSVLLVLLVGQFGALAHDPLLDLTRGESDALAWLQSHTGQGDLILASPRTGALIPAYTGRRVVYGHPFETVDAPLEQAAVEGFFQTASTDPQAARAFLTDRRVDWIFYGPSEAALGRLGALNDLAVAYNREGVLIYRVGSP